MQSMTGIRGVKTARIPAPPGAASKAPPGRQPALSESDRYRSVSGAPARRRPSTLHVIIHTEPSMQTALILIDVQESFRHRSYWSEAEVPRFLERTHALLDGCRAGGIPVVRILHSDGPE